MIDYILGGHEMLYPAGKRGTGDHLDSQLRLFQRSFPRITGEREARIFYTPGSTRMKLDVRRAVRRFRWPTPNSEQLWPALPTRVETYRVLPALGKRIDQVAKNMENELRQIKVEMNIHAEFGTGEADDSIWITRSTPRLSRRISANAVPVQFDLCFPNSPACSDLNIAWEVLWDAMGASFKPSNRIRALVKYPIRLDRLVTMLCSEAK
jgi:hypothetical protein